MKKPTELQKFARAYNWERAMWTGVLSNLRRPPCILTHWQRQLRVEALEAVRVYCEALADYEAAKRKFMEDSDEPSQD